MSDVSQRKQIIKRIRARKTGARAIATRKRASQARGHHARVISIERNPITPAIAASIADVCRIALCELAPTHA